MNRSPAFLTVVHYLFHYPFTALIVFYLIIGHSINRNWNPEKTVLFWSRTLFKSLRKEIEISGVEYLNQSSNRVVVLNHASLFDIPAVLTVLPGGSFLGRSKLLRIPLFGSMLKMLNYIPIDPKHIRQSIDALNRGISSVEKGRSIILFPEGTRTISGEILPFKRGFVKILRKTNADLQVITLNGFFNLKSKYRRTLNGSEPLSIVIHRPIKSEELLSFTDHEIIDLAKSITESAYKYKGNNGE